MKMKKKKRNSRKDPRCQSIFKAVQGKREGTVIACMKLDDESFQRELEFPHYLCSVVKLVDEGEHSFSERELIKR